jgi:hypothetical protein
MADSTKTWVSWIIECKAKVEDVSAILTLVDAMSIDFHESEPDTLNFECSYSEQLGIYLFHERYANSESAQKHIEKFGSAYAGKFLELLDIRKVTVFGFPTESLAETLAGMNPYMATFTSGFNR